MEDAKIIELFWARKEAAIAETAAAYGSRLQRLSVNIVESYEDAKECVNDTYLKAWNTIPPQRPTYFFAYLAKICRYLSFGKLDKMNAKKRKAEIVELSAEMELCIPDKRMEDKLEGEEIGRLLNRFLGNLSEENRLLFMRRYWYTDSIQEIADRFGFTESKVKVSLHRTRTKLRNYLESEGIYL